MSALGDACTSESVETNGTGQGVICRYKALDNAHRVPLDWNIGARIGKRNGRAAAAAAATTTAVLLDIGIVIATTDCTSSTTVASQYKGMIGRGVQKKSISPRPLFLFLQPDFFLLFSPFPLCLTLAGSSATTITMNRRLCQSGNRRARKVEQVRAIHRFRPSARHTPSTPYIDIFHSTLDDRCLPLPHHLLTKYSTGLCYASQSDHTVPPMDRLHGRSWKIMCHT
eukprot:scaffold170744_cov56-Attheya_sp.AAC.2